MQLTLGNEKDHSMREFGIMHRHLASTRVTYTNEKMVFIKHLCFPNTNTVMLHPPHKMTPQSQQSHL